jgi:uncharacterized protein
MESPSDCTACGACCFTDRHDWVPVFGVDVERMDARARALTREIDGRRFMHIEHGRCAALTLVGGRYLCSIYPQRPDACHWLQRGSGECLVQVREKRTVADEAMALAERAPR